MRDPRAGQAGLLPNERRRGLRQSFGSIFVHPEGLWRNERHPQPCGVGRRRGRGRADAEGADRRSSGRGSGLAGVPVGSGQGRASQPEKPNPPPLGSAPRTRDEARSALRRVDLPSLACPRLPTAKHAQGRESLSSLGTFSPRVGRSHAVQNPPSPLPPCIAVRGQRFLRWHGRTPKGGPRCAPSQPEFRALALAPSVPSEASEGGV